MSQARLLETRAESCQNRVRIAPHEQLMLSDEEVIEYRASVPWKYTILKFLKWLRIREKSDLVIAWISVALFAYMSIHFYVPSSLYIYVVCICFTAPAIFTTAILRLRHGRTDQKKRLLITGGICTYVIVCLLADCFSTRSSYPHQPNTHSKYYIVSLLHNSETILPHYSHSLIQLTKELGPSNVYVSIYENDSKDLTPTLLHKLDGNLRKLGVRTKIVTAKRSEQESRKNRIERLSAYRNLAMAPLNDELHGKLDGIPFEKVIWINDILFESSTVHQLLNTEGGQFDQACAMDYCWLGFYDTYV